VQQCAIAGFDLIDAMYEIARAAQPITGRGVECLSIEIEVRQ
jgi:hypothetical protein